ncbi:hypothetical protein [Sphingobium fuliginis]|uniref:hypothetical protein n=1 Tax=Sphingobium fuliginis (strain ATCC 27551) TaxID=336203 RepID=UPI0020C80C78|nr:hypothetical protein [Sphingobium fuliginis]
MLSRTQRWMWLGVSALVGGAGWGVVMLAMGALDWASSLSVGLLVLMLGMALPVLAFSGTRAALLRMGAAVVAAGQMAALVATGGFGLLQWGLFGLLSLMLVWLGRDAPCGRWRRSAPVSRCCWRRCGRSRKWVASPW